MHRVALFAPRRVDQPGDVQVAVRRGGGADADRAIGMDDVGRGSVGLGERVTASPPSPEREEETLFACGCAMMMSRKLFLDVGGFDEAYFAFYEDVDLGWRLWVLGHPVRYSPESLVYHQGDASFAKTPSESRQLLWNRNTLLTLLKNYDDEHLARFFPVALLLTIERAFGVTPARAVTLRRAN